MARKQWSYADARYSATGTMECGACRGKITEGQFRYRQKSYGHDWGYVQTHRRCCPDDPEWARRDERDTAHQERQKRFVAACIEFRNEWGVDDLDHYIPGSAA